MTDEALPPAAPTSAGAMLRAAREQRGMHIGVLAASIKVAQRKLEALEADRYDELPDMTFTRALALTVCRTLKIDPEPVLAQLPQPPQTNRLERVASGLNAPFREGRHEPVEWPWLKRPVFWATALVLIAAAVIALLPDRIWERLAATPEAPGPASAPTTSVVVDTTPAASEPLATPAEASSAVEQAASAVEAAPAAPVPNAVLRARAESWVEVQDAGGRTLVSRTLHPGETLNIDGALPLKVKIGNAPATELVFRDRRVDLAPLTGRDKVAILELK